MEKYFNSLKDEVNKAYNYAQEARKKGYDPSYDVEIIRANDTAARVEGILSVIYPELLNANLKEFIRNFEKEYGKNDLRVSLKIAEAIAKNKVLFIESKEKRADLAIRSAVAYLTLGVVTAPLEGISQVKIRKNDDGSEYLAVYYAGPIRSAGGTASAMSVLIADFVRKIVGLDVYKPTEEEINRYYTEVEDYYTRVAAKQYHPTKQEIELIIKNVPVEITGEPTEKIEVSNYKDLPRVETNKIRGGMCLILLDGLPLKAEKMLKFVKKYAHDFGIEHWFWLEDFITLKKKIHAAVKIEDVADEKPKYVPSTKYLDKLVGGRPVLSFPAEKGGFRLRYGKSFTNGLAGVNLSVGVFYLFDHLAMGTQVALEGPGKAAVVMPHNALENPIVLLNNGDVIEIKGEEDVKKYKTQIKEILYLGDILIPFGEFVSNNHVLLPAGYAEEWWLLELKQHNKQLYEKYKKFWVNYPSFNEAVNISEKYNIGLHPKYNLFWHDISKEHLKVLVKHLYNNLSYTEGELVLHFNTEVKQILEDLSVLHKIREERIILEESYWIYDLLFRKYNDLETIYKIIDESADVMDALMKLSGLIIRKRAPTYLGLRMGRPEKAKIRKMKGSPQMLFPVGEEGGKRRNLMESYNHGKIKVQIVTYKCLDCGNESYYKRCMHCSSLNTKYVMYCSGKPVFEDKECNAKPQLYAIRNIDVKWLTDKAYERVGMEKLDLVKGVRGVSGEKRAVELIEKGLLRAKYDLYVNKDGTIRFDATDIPLTHFRPRDIGVNVEKLKELGYTHDVYGNPLESENQILVLKPQDIIIPENEDVSSAEVLLKTAQFLDELLVKVYGMEPYYNFKSKEDIIGTLVVGLAPHTSAGIVGRVIGFGKAKGVLAHPYWHAAKRRNCDGDEDSIMLLLDAFLNFSREYLPDTRGAKTMDVPLVLTTVLNPEEVDDESWNFEVVSEYPLKFYEATLQYKTLDELSNEEFPSIAEHKIRAGQPFDLYFTLEQEIMFDAPIHSKYVEIPDMAAKVREQLEISRKIRAADENKVAEEIIKKHLLKDIKGNLRQFSRQKFRCIDCNEKYRRIPLTGKCTKCGGNIVLTVSEGSIRKYVDVIKDIIAKYKISSYTIQNFKILEENIETMFGKKTRQKSLFG